MAAALAGSRSKKKVSLFNLFFGVMKLICFIECHNRHSFTPLPGIHILFMLIYFIYRVEVE